MMDIILETKEIDKGNINLHDAYIESKHNIGLKKVTIIAEINELQLQKVLMVKKQNEKTMKLMIQIKRYVQNKGNWSKTNQIPNRIIKYQINATLINGNSQM
ncbi:unnamed protein product [Paramecium sonneborni]|uniref:Uncharacterized protein n=1 Tax=Paramecium sonneborni TaxID=65129 RepID=A0A8S1RTC1_9CILI|nr:unnamed protein product [Paramecium sonneborni]